MDNKKEMKNCKYCMAEIPKKSKICPNCKKKQGGNAKFIILGILVFLILACAIGGKGNSTDTSKDESVKKTSQENTSSQETEVEDESVDNVFNVGDVAETKDLKITFVSSGEYTSDNRFVQPKDGFKYWEFEFKFENISDSDQAVSTMMDWECYADNSKCDQEWIGDNSGLDGAISSGRETQGTVYFQVPEDATDIELEYNINFLNENKIIFVGK